MRRNPWLCVQWEDRLSTHEDLYQLHNLYIFEIQGNAILCKDCLLFKGNLKVSFEVLEM